MSVLSEEVLSWFPVYTLLMNCCSLSLLSLAAFVVVPDWTASRSVEDRVEPVASVT